MPALGPALLQALWAGWVLTLQPLPPAAFTPNGTYLQHLARDPTSGTLYLGATNFLFQLSPGLQLEATVSTGPVLDSRDCLPPVMPDECPQAQPTNNPNQLLLVSPGALVVCGSVHQGVCEQRRLGQLEQLLLRPERPGDTQYVAANDPAVSTVGLVAQGLAGEPLLFVGRGYTSRGVGGGIPPITTRALWPPDPQAAFSYEETAKLAVGRLSEYSHHFVSAFARGASAYFLFLRRDLQAQSRAFRAYVSRVCLRDQHYYSYVELPLACEGGRYGLIQAAAVATSREVAHGEVLFAAFSSAAPPTVGRPPSAAAGASGASALCAFPLDEVDRLANRTRDACYTREGRAEDGTEVAYIEYDVNSDCAQLPVDTLDAYPCGSDHTPSPMASRVPLEATPILEWPGIQLTAVAVAMEDGHTIAFLGDSQGQLHRVYLGPGSDGHPYSTQSIQQGSAVSRDLTFDGTFEHLYVMTQSTLLKVPVASCAQHLDCASCLARRDPYCGWCVLLGRCSRRSECSRGQGPEQWLWSFQPELGCLQVAAMSPANISREETREVFLSVPDLPPLWPGESYSCHFGEHQSPALLTGSGVMCPSPDPSEAPVLPRGADYVSVSVELRFGTVVIAKTSLSFYDCVAVTELRPSAQCQACVSSRWGCNWCVWQHLCTHKASCDAGPMVASHQSPLVSPDPPARGGPSPSPPTAPKALATPAPDTLPVEPGAPSTATASDISPGASPSLLSPWGPWAGSGPISSPGSTESPLHEEPSPPSPQNGPGTAVPAPTDFRPSATPEDLLASPLSPSEVAAVPPADPGPEALHPTVPLDLPPATVPATTFPGAMGSVKPALDWLTREGGELPEADEWTGGDAPAFSTSTLLSGDGDSAELEGPPAPLILPSSLDYQYDTPGLWELEEATLGASSCPCVESVQGSTLMPVHVEREIRLLGRNLHLFQDGPGDNECVMELEGLEVVVEARVECEPPPDTQCHVTCQQHQLSYEALQPELRVGLFLRRAGRLRVDSAEGLHVVLYDCSVGHGDCSRCQTAMPQYGCVWCEGERPRCVTREACGEAEAVATQCPAPLIHSVEPLTGPVDGGTRVTIRGSNLGQHVQDVLGMVTVAGVPCAVDAQEYEVSSRRKSKQALRDYKKVQIQLENLESSVRDRCKKEFTDLMTEMTDLTSDLLGSGIPFLDYKVYAERIFFPGHRESPLHRDLGVPESRRPTVEQGLGQLSNLLNSKLFLTKFIHTLESQRTFSARDRAYVASLLTVALHGKLEYFTDILRTLLSDLVAQYVAKNPKLMLRRTETVVEKLLTNWMSICLYTFVRDSVGEPLYMLFRGIKHQVDKGPVDSVTGKAKYTLNDNRLLREDVEYRPLTLNALLAVGPGAGEAQGVPVKVLDCDTISQAKEKMLDQLYKGVPLTQRPDPRTLDVEWRSGVAGHLILSDEDVTSEVQGLWRRLNTLQHYKVPDGATVALVPCLTKHVLRENQDYVPGERTPMLEDVDEGGIRPWHLVKPSDEPEPPRPRRGSLRGGERERAKAIPEIYLTRLLSMKGTLQKFVDDLFQVILSTSRPVPLAVKYFFDLLDEQAQQHGISDQDTIHIWKTNSLPLRFWINIIKNPQFVFDVQTSDNMDAVLLVIAQTFMDACTLADHKLGRDSPINKLLYARDIPRYKRMVERYYADIRQTVPASDQEMNSVLAELSWNYSGDLGARVALHELYKYINKYYDQIITALEEDGTAQKMQLGYRLQQIAAAVENKVTDL
ncbi:plexin-B1 isoform X3 [Gorilla gorilla gorilla]|uniref:plexin-B1 isoform X3 n=1 Tax=Gorilla gorilla gorilla TaxID=9595 RepID=UPI0030080D02